MSVLTFPSLKPSALEFGLRARTQSFQSALTASTQTIRMIGAYWYGSMSFSNLVETDARLIQAFLVSLEGQHGRFYFGDVSNETVKGYMGGRSETVRVNGASQTGGSLIVDGLPNSQTVFKAGDMIQFTGGNSGRELKMITADATSNGSGQATLAIKPNIRSSPANDAQITYANTTCIMRLVGDNEGAWNVKPPILSAFSIGFIEAI